MTKLLVAVSICSLSVVAAAQPADKTAKPASAPAAGNAAAGAAAGTAGAPSGEMMPPKPGPETEALKPFSHSTSMTGTVPAGAMGKNPEMASKGKSTCKWIASNMWVACDIDMTYGTGKQAMKWSGHWVYGYDLVAKGYRGVLVSSMGDHLAMKGTLEGTKLSWESMESSKAPGMPSKMRISEDASDPKAIKFTQEAEMGGKWNVMSTAVEKPLGK